MMRTLCLGVALTLTSLGSTGDSTECPDCASQTVDVAGQAVVMRARHRSGGTVPRSDPSAVFFETGPSGVTTLSYLEGGQEKFVSSTPTPLMGIDVGGVRTVILPDLRLVIAVKTGSKISIRVAEPVEKAATELALHSRLGTVGSARDLILTEPCQSWGLQAMGWKEEVIVGVSTETDGDHQLRYSTHADSWDEVVLMARSK